MSAIYKLSIQGIRSFDSNDRETIEFGKPLTLIVGSNGSGKTTIIECLKYATSGDLPPNSKGGAFVHDPKITGEKDVRAQVKLAFTSANGLNMIVTRNIQLLVKKTAATFKTLEGQLVIVNNNGERSTLSTRSVELDAQVPLYMGVPKAILEYVIFCHQEDSLWPLSEPSNLKKKFDEIFQAMKFTKALDNLKGIKKDMSVDIKLLKQAVEHLKVDKDRSESVKSEVSQLESNIENYNKEVKELEEKITAITAESDKLFKTNQDFQKTLSKVENLKHNRNSVNEQIIRLRNAVDIIDSPRNIIENRIKNFSSSLEEREMLLETKKKDLDRMKLESQKYQNECNTLMRRQGELAAKKDTFEKNKEVLSQLYKDLSQKYPSCKDEAESDDDFLTELKLVKSKLDMEFEQLECTGKLKLEQLKKELSDIHQSKIIQKERLDYSKMDREKLIKEVDRLDTELQLSEFNESDLVKEKEILEKFTLKLNNWEKDNGLGNVNLEIKKKNDDMLILESELEVLQSQISKTNLKSALFAKLSVMKKLIEEKTSEIAQQHDAFKTDENFMRWNINDKSNIDIEFKRVSTKLEKELSSKEIEYQTSEKKLTEITLEHNNVLQELTRITKRKAELNKYLEENLPEDCPIDDYNEVLADTELSYKTALENLKMHQTTLAFNRKAIEVARNDSTCYLCSRKFDDSSFKHSLLNKLQAKIDVNFENGLKETTETEKEYLTVLRSLERDILEYRGCDEKSDCLQDTEIRSKSKVQDLQKCRDLLYNELKDMKNEMEIVDKIIRPLMEGLNRSKKELRDLQGDIQAIYDELSLYGSSENDIETVDELQQKQGNKNDLLRRLRKEINELQDAKESRSREYSNLLNLIKERDIKVSEIERELCSTKSIQEDIVNKRREIESIGSSISKMELEIEALVKKELAFEEKESNASKEFEFNIAKKQADIKSVANDVERLIGMKEAVANFEYTVLPELGNTTESLDTCEKNLQKLNVFIDDKTSELSNEIQIVKDSRNEKRNLEQNLQLLDLKENLKVLHEQITEIDISNAEIERDKYQTESQRLRNEYEHLSSENAGKLGEIRQLQNQIDSLTRQLRTDYRDINDLYHKKWVELQTKTFVSDDIDTYSKALDSAIMKYHGLKMQDINRIIDELWKGTYSGTDVDSIQIRSDEMKSGVKGKSYNYRVVMYKQDAELDMRGRCSAGQKVLASIIIRLALSETFGVNCGVIALDEPTTNLDEENIESLAKSLNNIIQLRRHQKNFQLIVITHDEKFLNNMNASEFTDHFFRVKRDDRQKSQIEWVDISRVVE